VQLTHTGDNGLVRLFVSPYAERRVFFSQTTQSQERMEFPEPVISIAVEPKTKADQEKMGLALGRLATSSYVFQTDCSSDVARANFFDLFTFVSVHLYDTTEVQNRYRPVRGQPDLLPRVLRCG
jgi:hypothetical protein